MTANLINNDQGVSPANISISGVLKYATNDYGASWATTATIAADLLSLFPVPQNGDAAVLRNTNGTDESRVYFYAASAWENVAIAAVSDGAITDAKLATDVKVGSLADLDTTETGSVVGAINEVVTTAAEIGTLADLTTTAKTDLVVAINEVDASIAAVASTAAAAVAAVASTVAAAAEAASDAVADASTVVAAISAKASLTGEETLTNKTLTDPILDDGDAGLTLDSADQTNASAKVIFPDSGVANAYVAMSTAALTLAEVDVLQDVTAGTVAASKVAVLGTDKELDEFHTAALYLGSGAGTAITASAAELNKCDGISATAYQVVSEMVTFTETEGAGTYTGAVTVPAGSIVHDVVWKNDSLWTATTSATLNVGDTDDADGYFSAIDLKAAPLAATAAVPTSISSLLEDAGSGAYKGLQKYSATAQVITASVVTDGAAGDAGVSRMFVTYSTPTAVAAIKA